jgi:hypothetical protein
MISLLPAPEAPPTLTQAVHARSSLPSKPRVDGGSQMALRPLAALALLLASALPAAAQAGGRGLPTLAPYRDIHWTEGSDVPRVLLGAEWLELLSIDGRSVPDLVAAARSGFGNDWQRRFDEDLVEVMALLGAAPREAVALGLREPTNGQTFTRSASMTPANRQSVLCNYRAGFALTAQIVEAR